VKASAVIDDLLESVVHFTGDTSESRLRIVFDVELATEFPVCGNPIVFTYDQIGPLLQRQRPCADLYCLLMFAAVLTLPSGGFDEEDEACVAAVAAAAAFQKKWSKVSPFDFAPQHLPERSKQLWSVYQKPGGEKAMIRALSRAQEAVEGESMWTVFLTELRNLANIPPDYFADQEGPKAADHAAAVVPDASPFLQEFLLNAHTLTLSK
jgi:hypothetical protein